MQDEVTLALSENKMTDEINKTKGATGGLKTKEALVNELVDKGYLTNDDKTKLEIADTITIGSVAIDFSSLPKEDGVGENEESAVDSINSKIGTVVSGYTAGNLEWQVYYADERETFLISTTVVETSYDIPATGYYDGGHYITNWNAKWLSKSPDFSNSLNARKTVYMCA